MLTKTQTNATAAAYMREHRLAWKEAGFSGITNMAHENDAARVQSYTTLLKFERLLMLVNAGDEEAIKLAISRNTPKMPMFDEMKTLEDRVAAAIKNGKTGATEAKGMLAAVHKYAKKASMYRAVVDDDYTNLAAKAHSLIYSNLAGAAYKMVAALLSSPDLGEDYE
tara:strand:+ start:10210 stop:10710 length:501 start_codon:yes stop_codon:yes gene_type:complete